MNAQMHHVYARFTLRLGNGCESLRAVCAVQKSAIEQWNFVTDATGGCDGSSRGVTHEVEAERGVCPRHNIIAGGRLVATAAEDRLELPLIEGGWPCRLRRLMSVSP